MDAEQCGAVGGAAKWSGAESGNPVGVRLADAEDSRPPFHRTGRPSTLIVDPAAYLRSTLPLDGDSRRPVESDETSVTTLADGHAASERPR